ncbi:MAG: ABC transporter permease, partial [Blastocatellia bacterium]
MNGRPEVIPGARVSEDYFMVFGVSPLLGRTFHADEFLRNGSQAIVLSYSIWQKRFGADPSVVGRTIIVDKRPATVAGVMPREFQQPAWAQVWTPLASDTGEMQDRASRYFTLYARVKQGVSVERGQTELSAVADRLANQYPQIDRGWSVKITPLREAMAWAIRAPLLDLFAAVAMVLLIACINVAGLLLARGARRQAEFATRAALGASRARIWRQLMTENVLIGLLGSGAGLAMAGLGMSALKTFIPKSLNFPRLDDVRLDLPVFAFTIALSVITCLVFGLLPTARTSSANLGETLKAGGQRVASGMGRMRAILVGAEIALTLILLTGAGLMARSFVRLSHVDCGFDTRNLLTISVG